LLEILVLLALDLRGLAGPLRPKLLRSKDRPVNGTSSRIFMLMSGP
jgi:hypothetical protein